MASRADHYAWADALVWKVRRQLDGGDWRDEDMPSMALQVAAAQVHATLAAAGPGVEQEVRDNEKRAAQAVGAAESSQRARQAARPPLPPKVCHDSAGGVHNGLLADCRVCNYPGMGAANEIALAARDAARVEETAGTVRPKPDPAYYCTCAEGGGIDGRHQRGRAGCRWAP